jgi:hypothetical protein
MERSKEKGEEGDKMDGEEEEMDGEEEEMDEEEQNETDFENAFHEKRAWSKRPDNWMEILDYNTQHGIKETKQKYSECLKHYKSQDVITATFRRWKREKKKLEKRNFKVKRKRIRFSAFGKQFEKELFEKVQLFYDEYGFIDELQLRKFLKEMLKQLDYQHISESRISHSWCMRFFSRWGIPGKRLKRKNTVILEHMKTQLQIDKTEHDENDGNNEQDVHEVHHEVRSDEAKLESGKIMGGINMLNSTL